MKKNDVKSACSDGLYRAATAVPSASETFPLYRGGNINEQNLSEKYKKMGDIGGCNGKMFASYQCIFIR